MRFPGPRVGVVAVVVIGLLIVGGIVVFHDDEQSPSAASSARFAPRVLPAVTWTGQRLFVFGGNARDGRRTLLRDGALIDPASGTTVDLPPAPIDPPLYAPQSTLAGGAVVVIGTSCTVLQEADDSADPVCDPGTYAGAAFNLERRRWTRLHLPARFAAVHNAQVLQMLGATADGRAVVRLGHPSLQGFEQSFFWLYDPATDTWVELPQPGSITEAACFDGHRIVTMSTGSANGVVGLSLRTLDLRHREEVWSESTLLDNDEYPHGALSLACAGEHVIVLDDLGPTQNARYDVATRAWAAVPASPLSGSFAIKLWTGRELLALSFGPSGPSAVGGADRQGEAFEPATNTWRVLRDAPTRGRRAFWTGTFVVGYAELGRAGVFSYRPR